MIRRLLAVPTLAAAMLAVGGAGNGVRRAR